MGRFPQVRACATVKNDAAVLRKALERAMRVLPMETKTGQCGNSGFDGDAGPDYNIDATLMGASRPPDIIAPGGSRDCGQAMYLFAPNPLKVIEKMEMIRP